jgi:hypothetical protein
MNDKYPGVPLDRRRHVSESNAATGFLFPASFMSLIQQEELPDVAPVFWLVQMDMGVEDWTELLEKQYPDRTLVPFAKDRRTDDVFYFDGRDTSGNPPVILIHSFTEPGWEYRGEWLHFDSWYAGLVEFHEAWARGEDDGFEPPQPATT